MTTTDLLTADVLVVGAGPAGMTAALLLEAGGLDVLCIDAQPLDAPDDDLRTAALLQPSIALLERLDVWPRLVDPARPRATPLRVMRMIDAGGAAQQRRANVDFAAGEIQQDAFGWNVANADLRAALRARAAEAERLRLLAPVSLAHLAVREDAVRATLADGRRISAAVVVGADGRRSTVRAALGVGVRRVDYGQQAMVFHVAHTNPHEGVSTEIFRTGGPFTLVPHYGVDDAPHRSAVVWMERNQEVGRLMAAERSAFEAEINARSLNILGPLRLVSERRAWPVISAAAERLHAPRAALIAEAAHVVPPIGAQGLNMSFADAETLAELLTGAAAAGRDLGDAALLATYARRRWPDMAARIGATAALNVAAIGAARPIRDLRGLGLGAMNALSPLRQAAMRLGMGGG